MRTRDLELVHRPWNSCVIGMSLDLFFKITSRCKLPVDRGPKGMSSVGSASNLNSFFIVLHVMARQPCG